MKHIRKFEDLDYLSQLAAESDLRKKGDEHKSSEIEKRRSSETGNYLPKLAADKAERDSSNNMVNERKEIVDRVIESLRRDENNHPGYQSFKEELLTFLGEFPKE